MKIEDPLLAEFEEIRFTEPPPDRPKLFQTEFIETDLALTREHSLVAAMLIRAILDARATDSKIDYRSKDKTYNHYNKRKAIMWLSEEGVEPYQPFTCLWCLEQFHDDPESARKKILEMLAVMGPRIGNNDPLSPSIIAAALGKKL